MSASAKIPSSSQVLRRLFLTLFLRGRSSRGLRRATAPKTVGSKLAFMLFMYALIGGFMAASLATKPLFTLSLYLHSMTLVFLGMFVAASAGEVLFNKDEADILMHRPVAPKAMLWAKIGVLVQVSLWLAGAFNLVGILVGAFASGGGWLYPVVHAFTTACQALFCTGCVVLIYQLCLRWFGRERMEGLMTTAQVFVAVGAVLLGQIGPQLMGRYDLNTDVASLWWIRLLPPAWFAGLDDALSGAGAPASWILAAAGLAATATVLGLAFGKLARNYETGLQTLNESRSAPVTRGGRRWMDVLVKTPPLSWWLRNSVARASFLLTAAYLMRDRDVKLRVYPGLAPLLVMPVIFLLQETHPRHYSSGGAEPFGGFGVAFAGAYLGLIPFLALRIIRYSQQWQAADLFRVVPLSGPMALCHGARRAILCFLTVPLLLVFGGLVVLLGRGSAHLPLLLPGIISLPLYGLAACLGGKAVPFSLPADAADSTSRGLSMILMMLISALLAGAATVAWHYGVFKWFLLIEALVVAGIYAALRAILWETRWAPLDP